MSPRYLTHFSSH